ncbi:MAG: hypothetical protein Q9173_004526 [Seirophora scorigena]
MFVIFPFLLALPGPSSGRLETSHSSKVPSSGLVISIPERAIELRARQDTPIKSICGYVDGNPDRARYADVGWACRVDAQNALWGFCKGTAVPVSDSSDAQPSSRAAPSTRTGSFLFSPTSTLSTDVSSSTISGSDSAIITSAGNLAAATSMPVSQTSPGNNTGAIVGGVIGGLAFLGLLVFGILVLRRLKSRNPTAPHSSTPLWPLKKEKNNNIGTAKNHQDRWADQQTGWLGPMELEAEERRQPYELLSGKHGTSHELDSQRP